MSCILTVFIFNVKLTPLIILYFAITHQELKLNMRINQMRGDTRLALTPEGLRRQHKELCRLIDLLEKRPLTPREASRLLQLAQDRLLQQFAFPN